MSSPDIKPLTAPDTRLWDVWLSNYHLGVVTVSNKLGLFKLLSESPSTAEEITKKVKISSRGAEAILGVLCGLKLVAKHFDQYRLTETSKVYLLDSTPYNWLPRLETLHFQEIHDEIMKAVQLETICTDSSLSSWESGVLSDSQAFSITKSMHAHSFPAALGAAKNYDWSNTKKFLDIAGGSGIFTICIEKYNRLEKATVAELPAVCKHTKNYIEQFKANVDTLELNMFTQEFPKGYDTHFYSNVFHDWSLEVCKTLAQKSFDSLSSGGHILLHEMLLRDSKDGDLTPASFSLLMLVYTRGKQFTAPELQQILSGAGFVDFKATATYGYYSIVSARKP